MKIKLFLILLTSLAIVLCSCAKPERQQNIDSAPSVIAAPTDSNQTSAPNDTVTSTGWSFVSDQHYRIIAAEANQLIL